MTTDGTIWGSHDKRSNKQPGEPKVSVTQVRFACTCATLLGYLYEVHSQLSHPSLLAAVQTAAAASSRGEQLQQSQPARARPSTHTHPHTHTQGSSRSQRIPSPAPWLHGALGRADGWGTHSPFDHKEEQDPEQRSVVAGSVGNTSTGPKGLAEPLRALAAQNTGPTQPGAIKSNKATRHKAYPCLPKDSGKGASTA